MAELTLEPVIDREKSSEQLRLVLPLLSQHGSDFGPESYALWFSFVNADRPALHAELSVHVAQGERLSGESTHALYCRHLRDAESTTLTNVQEAFMHLLTEMASSSSRMHTINASSQAHIQAIAAPVSVPEFERGRAQFAEHAQLVAASLLTFGSQLSVAQSQVNDLRDELRLVRGEARVDALTTLQNRRAFDETLLERAGDALADDTPLALIMIDVDHFKAFNDQLGHVMGDKALRTVAGVIQQNVKGKDFAARYGGEEFAVLLPDTALVHAIRVAENLRAAVERIRIRKAGSGDIVRSLTVSCGVAMLKNDDALLDLVDRADSALYAAKQAGRNRVITAA